MENNILTNEEIEDMTLDEKEENLEKLKKAIWPYKHMVKW
jgi:hypothetical protein